MMPGKAQETKRQDIQQLAARCDGELRKQFGAAHFDAGYCFLLGRYYAQSPYIYFSLNPGFPRNGLLLDPASPEGYNVPFRNPPALRKQYVYLHNCERFLAAHPALDQWINDGVTSAFLAPWRTANVSELYQLNRLTHGRLFACAGEMVKQIVRDHKAKLLLTAGKSAVQLLRDLRVTEGSFEQFPIFGPGKSYQWSKGKLSIEGREVNILQIPHFSRANSPVKMRELGLWLREELKPYGLSGAEAEPISRR